MSTNDRERWDTRYRGEHGKTREPPLELVLRALERVQAQPGTALDLAAGTGRHALELARRGWSCEAWDVSPVGLSILAERAAEEGLSIRTRAVDLSRPLHVEHSFDLVCVVHFLERDLFAKLCDLVSPGGHAIVATFTTDYPGDKPSPLHRLAPGELARGLPGLETLFTQESGGRAGLLGRRIDSS